MLEGCPLVEFGAVVYADVTADENSLKAPGVGRLPGLAARAPFGRVLTSPGFAVGDELRRAIASLTSVRSARRPPTLPLSFPPLRLVGSAGPTKFRGAIHPPQPARLGMKGAGVLGEPRRRKHWNGTSGAFVSEANEGPSELCSDGASEMKRAASRGTRERQGLSTRLLLSKHSLTRRNRERRATHQLQKRRKLGRGPRLAVDAHRFDLFLVPISDRHFSHLRHVGDFALGLLLVAE